MSPSHGMHRELPAGWTRAKLGDLLVFEYGSALPARSRDESGKVPVYGSSGIVGRHTAALTDRACLVVGRKGSVGSVFQVPQPCWPIDTTYFAAPPVGLDLAYAFHLLSSIGLDRLDRSTAVPGLNRNDAYEVALPLPPLPEQRRLVARIEELFTRLDAGVAALERAQALLERYRQSVLKEAFEGRLTAAWREAH
ncbi:MAG: type I restriction endonuclease subunit S, partial [Chloroflexi bacterium]|nr:type I restriction endonuclease subunit S [Chloroflexota bacterium]